MWIKNSFKAIKKTVTKPLRKLKKKERPGLNANDIEQNMMTNDSDSAFSETEKLPLVDLTQPGPSHTATEAVVPLITLED
ncbi:hypothetical protein TYRP_007705, partial [Tyrophagus putrescentiae]